MALCCFVIDSFEAARKNAEGDLWKVVLGAIGCIDPWSGYWCLLEWVVSPEKYERL